MDNKGIVIAGSIIADVVKTIKNYPKQGMMTYISDITYSVGGCVPNTAIDIAKIDKDVRVSAIGKVGSDEYGRFILTQLENNGVDVSKISLSSESPTSFCDVMSMSTGERTFFHKKGAKRVDKMN